MRKCGGCLAQQRVVGRNAEGATHPELRRLCLLCPALFMSYVLCQRLTATTLNCISGAKYHNVIVMVALTLFSQLFPHNMIYDSAEWPRKTLHFSACLCSICLTTPWRWTIGEEVRFIKSPSCWDTDCGRWFIPALRLHFVPNKETRHVTYFWGFSTTGLEKLPPALIKNTPASSWTEPYRHPDDVCHPADLLLLLAAEMPADGQVGSVTQALLL